MAGNVRSVTAFTESEYEAATALIEAEAETPLDDALQLPTTIPVTVVDTVAALHTACDHLSAAPFVGLDCEWRASRPGEVTRVALLQLATTTQVHTAACPATTSAAVIPCGLVCDCAGVFVGRAHSVNACRRGRHSGDWRRPQVRSR